MDFSSCFWDSSEHPPCRCEFVYRWLSDHLIYFQQHLISEPFADTYLDEDDDEFNLMLSQLQRHYNCKTKQLTTVFTVIKMADNHRACSRSFDVCEIQVFVFHTERVLVPDVTVLSRNMVAVVHNVTDVVQSMAVMGHNMNELDHYMIVIIYIARTHIHLRPNMCQGMDPMSGVVENKFGGHSTSGTPGCVHRNAYQQIEPNISGNPLRDMDGHQLAFAQYGRGLLPYEAPPPYSGPAPSFHGPPPPYDGPQLPCYEPPPPYYESTPPVHREADPV
ncbi:hypothetical protein HW555_010876, partial [Spodoptera exigua]